jgi:hypothetical protein
MEPEGSLSCSQEPATCSYPEPNESNPTHPIKIAFGSSGWNSGIEQTDPSERQDGCLLGCCAV